MLKKFLLSLLVSGLCAYGAALSPQDGWEDDEEITGFCFSTDQGPHRKPIHEELGVPKDQVDGLREVVLAHRELLRGIAQESLAASLLLGAIARIVPAKRSAVMKIIDDYNLLERRQSSHQEIHIPYQTEVIEILAKLDPEDLVEAIKLADQHLVLDKIHYLNKAKIFRAISEINPKARFAQLKMAVSERKRVTDIKEARKKTLEMCGNDISKLPLERLLLLFTSSPRDGQETLDWLK